jgi:hypothetical protein
MKTRQIVLTNSLIARIEYRNSKKIQHRTNGPATVWFNGSINWYKNGYFHRSKKPAWIFANGQVNYWKKGERYFV